MTQDEPLEPELVEEDRLAVPKKISGYYRKAELPLPDAVQKCPGISLFGRVLRSFVFSTDLAIIRNCDADAVLAVYPFTCQPSITQGLLNIAERPVFAGVSGSLTTGVRSVELAMQSEMQGATGVVVNAATPPDVIEGVARSIDIPVVLTVAKLNEYAREQIESGAQIVNVAAGKDTPQVVAEVRKRYPGIPIIASGGGTDASIAATVEAGADAVSWTPPSMYELERANMQKNRGVQASSAQQFAEGRISRASDLLQAASRAAERLKKMGPEVQQTLAEEGAKKLSVILESRLDDNEQLLFRQLLAKVLIKDADEAPVAQQAADEGRGADGAE